MKRSLFLILFAILAGCAQVDDGEVGVINSRGHISSDPIMSGWTFYNPLTTGIEFWNVKTQELKETASVPSSEGLISSLDVSLIYQIAPNNAPMVRKTVGANYRDVVIQPFLRNAIRDAVSGHVVSDLFSETGRSQIADQIKMTVTAKLEPRGISVQDVLLRDVKLPDAFANSISEKLKAEQKALQKQYELQQAEKDAEIEIARAKGTAQSNQIVAGSITENYLRYRWIENLKDSDHLQVIYVPTEANLPVLEATRKVGK